MHAQTQIKTIHDIALKYKGLSEEVTEISSEMIIATVNGGALLTSVTLVSISARRDLVACSQILHDDILNSCGTCPASSKTARDAQTSTIRPLDDSSWTMKSKKSDMSETSVGNGVPLN
jgi:hypothetical protein